MKVPAARTYFDVVEEYAAQQPQSLAVICGERKVTYEQLAKDARRMARALQRQGITAGERIGLILNNRLEFVQTVLGANALGVTVVPFSTWSKQDELAFLLGDSGIRSLFMLEHFGAQDFINAVHALVPEAANAPPGAWSSQTYPQLREIVVLANIRPRGWQFFDSYQANLTTDSLPPADHSKADAVVVYTSGSSSKPKAVRLVNTACIENAFNIGERMGLTQADRVLVAPPLFWSYGAANALPAILSHGATIVLQGQFHAGEALDLIERHKCTALYTLPGMTNAMANHREFHKERTRSLRTGLTLGTPHDICLAAETLGAAEICNIYGLTETGGNCCVTDHTAPLAERADNQGPPLPHQKIRIVDAESRKPMPTGETGEVEVAGPYVTPGYSGASAELNAHVFTADGFFRTGDLGFLDDQGRFHFVARNTEIIKRGGVNVSPAEVEEVIQKQAGVAQVAVCGAPDAAHGEIIVAFVVAKPRTNLTADGVYEHCRDRLSSYKLPDHIELCDALPETETGKLARKKLKELAIRVTAKA